MRSEERREKNQDNKKKAKRKIKRKKGEKVYVTLVIHIVKADMQLWNYLSSQTSLDHRDETWVEWDLQGGQQTAWHINHPNPMGDTPCRETQVAEKHGLAGSVHTERLPKSKVILLYPLFYEQRESSPLESVCHVLKPRSHSSPLKRA